MALTQLFANQAQTTLAGAITSTALTANLSPGSGVEFPSPGANQYFTMILNDAATGLVYEEVWVTNVTGDTITMLRGQEGSTAKAWSAGDIAFNGWTAGSAGNFVQKNQAQANAFTYAIDTGSAANTYAIALTPSMPTGIDGSIVYFRPIHTNTGASTLTVNGGTSYSLVGGAHLALQGGEIFATGFAAAEFNSTLGNYVLLYCTGGAEQITTGTAANQAATVGQVQAASSIVGNVRNLAANVTTAGTSLTITADEITAEASLGGVSVKLASFNQSVSTTTTGIGGVVGTALTASGWAGIYAAYNPSTGAQGAFIVNAAAKLPSVAASLPSGWTFTALISVWPLNASTQFAVAYQQDRTVFYFNIIYTGTGTSGTPTAISIASAVPANGRTFISDYAFQPSSSGAFQSSIAPTSVGVGGGGVGWSGAQAYGVSGASYGGFYRDIPLITAQTTYFTTNGAGNWQLNGYGYTF